MEPLPYHLTPIALLTFYTKVQKITELIKSSILNEIEDFSLFSLKNSLNIAELYNGSVEDIFSYQLSNESFKSELSLVTLTYKDTGSHGPLDFLDFSIYDNKAKYGNPEIYDYVMQKIFHNKYEYRHFEYNTSIPVLIQTRNDFPGAIASAADSVSVANLFHSIMSYLPADPHKYFSNEYANITEENLYIPVCRNIFINNYHSCTDDDLYIAEDNKYIPMVNGNLRLASVLPILDGVIDLFSNYKWNVHLHAETEYVDH